MEWSEERFRDATNYWRARTLITAIELDVFGALARGPGGAERVAGALGTDRDATRLLLDALVGLELLELEDDGYRLGRFARDHLLRDGPGYVGDLPASLGRDWELWAALTERVRSGGSPGARDVFEGGCARRRGPDPGPQEGLAGAGARPSGPAGGGRH